MSYKFEQLSTAGRITIFTVIAGIACFLFVFLLNLGAKEFQMAVAQDNGLATTSVTVLNTPPVFTVDAQEVFESSTTTPTNATYVVQWSATALDANAQDYYLLICSNNATPTPNPNAAPECHSSATQWAVSAAASSTVEAIAATTTDYTATSIFAQSNPWYAFVCDADPGTPRCSPDLDQQGTGTSSSPFNVNNPPAFNQLSNTSPVDPDGDLFYYSTSTDTDDAGGDDTPDTVKLIVCNTSGFNTTTDTCDDTELASSTSFVSNDAQATFALSPPVIDATYNSFVFLVDNHGFEATSTLHGSTSVYVVNNVAPYILDGSAIDIQSGSTSLDLTVEAGETTGFRLDFTLTDNNSCTSTNVSTSYREITDFDLTLYRDGTANSSTTCDFSGTGVHDENDCYTSLVDSSRWNLVCTASSTSCTYNGVDDFDDNIVYNCTFPLWYIADPTDVGTQYPTDDWKAQVRGVDDDSLTGNPGETSSGIDVASFLALDLATVEIPYGSIAPGDNTDTQYPGGLGIGSNPASSTILATGNVGLDQLVEGDSMCPDYVPGAFTCPVSATSTIDDFRQVYSTTSSDTFAVASSSGFNLSSTSPTQVEINVFKSTATSTQESGITYWGIEIPSTINFSGDYFGQNTITAVKGEASEWGP